MKIYTMKDLVTVKIGGVTFKFSPLSYLQKMEINSELETKMAPIKCLKYSLKEVEGIETQSGPLKLTFDSEGLDNESLSNVLNTPVSGDLILAAYNLSDYVPEKIINPLTRKPLEGVEIVNPFLEKQEKV